MVDGPEISAHSAVRVLHHAAEDTTQDEECREGQTSPCRSYCSPSTACSHVQKDEDARGLLCWLAWVQRRGGAAGMREVARETAVRKTEGGRKVRINSGRPVRGDRRWFCAEAPQIAKLLCFQRQGMWNFCTMYSGAWCTQGGEQPRQKGRVPQAECCHCSVILGIFGR